MTDQERRDPRYPVSQELTVSCDSWGEFAELYASDVSRGGMFIITERPVPILSEVEVALCLPEGHQVQFKATVVHVIDREQAERENKRAGLGVQFTAIDAQRKLQIQQLVLFAHEAAAGDAQQATLASRMFESSASLPPSRVLGALPSESPLREDSTGGTRTGASGRTQQRASGQPSPRVSLRASTSASGEPGEKRATRRTAEEFAPSSITATGERRTRRTGEELVAPGSTSAPPVDKRTSRRTGEEFAAPLPSQQPGASSERPERRGNSLPALEGEAKDGEAAAAPKVLKPLDPAKLKLGMTHFAHKRYEHAIRVFEELVADTADKQAHHWLHMSRARLHLKRNDEDGAAGHYQRALEVDETNHEARKFVRQYSTKKRLNSLPFGRYFVKKE